MVYPKAYSTYVRGIVNPGQDVGLQVCGLGFGV